MNLLTLGEFRSHSGLTLPFKVECDALTKEDLDTAAAYIAKVVGPFSAVEGVPRGGLRLANALWPHSHQGGGLLIVDDVWTTGASMHEQRAGRKAKGAVLFAWNIPDWWVDAVFVLGSAITPPRRAPQSRSVGFGNIPDKERS